MPEEGLRSNDREMTEIKMQAKIGKITIRQLTDNDPDTSYMDQDGFEDLKRSYENGDFFYIGIKAEAEILTSHNGKEWLINTITSGGLWGIESNSDESHLESIRMEEEHDLKAVLLKFGFSDGEITKALDESETTTDY
jgi:hypothetical protein